jgi:phosphoglycerate dehydrogenase-like enzyme
MNSESSPMKIAILDDYQNIALKMADWSALAAKADITIFDDHLADPEALVERLAPFDIVCVMRERTPLPREVLQRLPRLKLIASTGPGNASIDSSAAKELGIAVTATGYESTPTIELTWALILASVRSIVRENEALRDGLWQTSIGEELSSKTLGVLGLGNIGGQVAQIGLAFGMNVIAWSQNMTPEIAKATGAKLVSKDELFRESDILTIHLVLSARTKGLVGPAELALMKPTARLINTSRGPIVDEPSLIKALRSHAIAGAAIDVFDEEPLPPQHPLRSMENVLATPHIGYVTDSLYRTFYGDVVKSITTWLDKQAAAANQMSPC